MSLFKFHDSNFINGYNSPDVVATKDTYNGYQFKLVDKSATPHATVAEAQAGEIYVMYNIIDKPEILNTDEYKVKAGESIRAFRLKDYVGRELDLSADLITDTWATVSVGDKLIPRTGADTTDTMKWKKAPDVTGVTDYKIYLEVVRKTTFGAFTIDGTVPGGYLVVVRTA